MKSAVIYYSKSGVTDKIAKKIQEKTGAKLYFVEPDKSYGGYLSSIAAVAGEKLTKKMSKPKLPLRILRITMLSSSVFLSGIPRLSSLFKTI